MRKTPLKRGTKQMARSYFRKKDIADMKPLKRSPLRRKGKISKPRKINLHRKAWDIFSKWVRERDKMCVTCGSTGNLEAGHFWHGVLDFDEQNINAQCKSCNHFKSGNLAPYSVYLIRKYGQKAFEDLEKRHYLAMKGEIRTDRQYLDIIEKYKI